MGTGCERDRPVRRALEARPECRVDACASGALTAAIVPPWAKALNLDVVALEIRRGEDIAPAFEQLNGRAQALYVCPDPLMLINRLRIITLALGQRLPTMFGYRDYVEAGGLISYGPNIAANFRRVAEIVDKILRGTKPGDIPVEQPVKFDLVINLPLPSHRRLAD